MTAVLLGEPLGSARNPASSEHPQRHLDKRGAALLPLYDRRGDVVAHAVIDGDRLAWASQWIWRLSTEGYACRSLRLPDGTLETRLLHRELLGLPVHGVPRIRFVNQANRLDVRRSNLRLSARWVMQAIRRDPALAAQVIRRAPKLAKAGS